MNNNNNKMRKEKSNSNKILAKIINYSNERNRYKWHLSNDRNEKLNIRKTCKLVLYMD